MREVIKGTADRCTLRDLFEAMEGFGHPDFNADEAIGTVELMGYSEYSDIELYPHVD